MSPVREAEYPYKDVAAIYCADIHISDKAPIARSAEPDWFAAMKRPLTQVERLAAYYGVPIFIAGDIFDKHNPHARTVNWAIDNLFHGQAIPGNHELPDHRYDKMKESAYWTLCEAQTVTNLIPGKLHEFSEFGLRAFPFGFDIEPCQDEWHEFYFYVAMAHQFVWQKGNTFHGAPEEHNVKKVRERLTGYQAAFFGDNHNGFINRGSPDICNCGGLLRRTRKEVSYSPVVMLLFRNGGTAYHVLDASEDKFFNFDQLAVIDTLESRDPELAAVCKELADLGETSCDFKEMVRRRAERDTVSKGVRFRIYEALEQQK